MVDSKNSATFNIEVRTSAHACDRAGVQGPLNVTTATADRSVYLRDLATLSWPSSSEQGANLHEQTEATLRLLRNAGGAPAAKREG